jgi:DNA-binding MarR family transcriptional regulator
VIPAELTKRQIEVLDVIRAEGSMAAAAKKLGVRYPSLTSVLKSVHAKGLIPDDLAGVMPRSLRPRGAA